MTAELGRRAAGQVAGVLAGVLCSAIPSVVTLAQTARPYAFAFLFAALSSLLLLAAVRTPTWWRWVGYAASLALTGVFHLVTVSVLAGHLVILTVAWWRERDRRLFWSLAAVGAALVALAPLIWLGIRQRHAQLHWVPTPTWETVATLPREIAYSSVVGYLLLGLAVAAYAALPARRYAELVALFAGPIVPVIGVSQVAPVWVPRYGIFLFAPLAAMAAATIISGNGRAKTVGPVARAVAVTGLLVFLSLPEQISIRQTHNGPDTRSIVSAIHEYAAEGDAIVYTDFAWSLRPTLTHYLDELDWTRTAQPPDILLKDAAAATGTLEARESEDVAGRLVGVRRIWLIGPAAGEFGAPRDPLAAPGEKIKYIGQRYQVKQSYTFQAGRAVLLVPRDEPLGPAKIHWPQLMRPDSRRLGLVPPAAPDPAEPASQGAIRPAPPCRTG